MDPEQKSQQILNPQPQNLNQQQLKDEMKQIEQPIQIKPQSQQAQQFIEDNLIQAERLKCQGNNLFKEQQYAEAINAYNRALKYASKNETKLRSVLYSNIAICFSKVQDFKNAITYCKKSIQNDNTYMKAHLNLALAYQKNQNPEQALEAYKKIIEINPNDIKSQIKVKQLQRVVQQLNEKRKKEVMQGLKGIGNSVLGFFGLSLNNFQMQQSQNGGYNVSFKN